MPNKLSVAEESGRAVMVGVEEGWFFLLAMPIPCQMHQHTQGLLLQEQEARVNQLKEFGKVVELHGLAQR